MRKVDPTFIFFTAFFVVLISVCVIIGSGILIDTRDWRRVYKNADNFEFVRQSDILTVFVLRDNDGDEICKACVDGFANRHCFVTRDDEIMLHGTNRYYSKRMAKKLMENLPGESKEVFQKRTFDEFEKHLKEYIKKDNYGTEN